MDPQHSEHPGRLSVFVNIDGYRRYKNVGACKAD